MLRFTGVGRGRVENRRRERTDEHDWRFTAIDEVAVAWGIIRSDGALYAVPCNAASVLRVCTKTEEVTFIGPAADDIADEK